MYTVIGKPMTRAFRVIWTLEELGQPYDLNTAAPHSQDILAVNPSGKVPTLVEDGEVITDSTAIITYLADKHGALTAPAGTLARAKQDAVMHQILDEIDAVLWTAARHSFALPEEQRVPEIKDSLRWEFERNIARLEKRLTGPYLMGEDFTVADIICVHCLNWAYGAKFPVESRALLDYSKTVRSREAFQRTAALAK
jgi:glutathione S-transferase